MPPKPTVKRNKKADKKELEKWLKENDLSSFVKPKALDSLGTTCLSDLVILTEDDVRSVNAFKPVELRKFMNAIKSYSSGAPDNSPGKPEPAKSPKAPEPKPSKRTPAPAGGLGKARAKFAWTAQADVQLSITEGETLTILDNSKKWWKMRNGQGDEGDVPSNYVEPIDDKDVPPSRPTKRASGKEKKDPNAGAKPDLPAEKEEDIYAPVTGGMMVEDGDGDEPDYEDPDQVTETDNTANKKQHWQRTDTVKIVPSTEPLGSDPLEWMNGEVIRWLTEKGLSDFKDVFYANGFDGATLVTLNSQSFKLGGFDPERCDALQVELDGLADPIIGRAKALYDYTATKPTQLSFKDGDILEVIDDGASWWKAKLSNGQKGMCPSNYLEMLPKESRSKSSRQSQEDRIEDAPWYCNRDRKQAEALLKGAGRKNGDFLIRPSRTNPGDHTLTALGPSGIMNLKIQEQAPGVFVLGQFSSQFSSIGKLVEHHGNQEIRITNKAPVLLMNPVRE